MTSTSVSPARPARILLGLINDVVVVVVVARGGGRPCEDIPSKNETFYLDPEGPGIGSHYGRGGVRSE